MTLSIYFFNKNAYPLPKQLGHMSVNEELALKIASDLQDPDAKNTKNFLMPLLENKGLGFLMDLLLDMLLPTPDKTCVLRSFTRWRIQNGLNDQISHFIETSFTDGFNPFLLMRVAQLIGMNLCMKAADGTIGCPFDLYQNKGDCFTVSGNQMYYHGGNQESWVNTWSYIDVVSDKIHSAMPIEKNELLLLGILACRMVDSRLEAVEVIKNKLSGGSSRAQCRMRCYLNHLLVRYKHTPIQGPRNLYYLDDKKLALHYMTFKKLASIKKLEVYCTPLVTKEEVDICSSINKERKKIVNDYVDPFTMRELLRYEARKVDLHNELFIACAEKTKEKKMKEIMESRADNVETVKRNIEKLKNELKKPEYQLSEEYTHKDKRSFNTKMTKVKGVVITAMKRMRRQLSEQKEILRDLKHIGDIEVEKPKFVKMVKREKLEEIVKQPEKPVYVPAQVTVKDWDLIDTSNMIPLHAPYMMKTRKMTSLNDPRNIKPLKDVHYPDEKVGRFLNRNLSRLNYSYNARVLRYRYANKKAKAIEGALKDDEVLEEFRRIDEKIEKKEHKVVSTCMTYIKYLNLKGEGEPAKIYSKISDPKLLMKAISFYAIIGIGKYKGDRRRTHVVTTFCDRYLQFKNIL